MSQLQVAEVETEEARRFGVPNHEFALAGIQQIGIAYLTPVIFTDVAGGGTGEFQAPTVLTQYTLDFPGLPAGANLVAAWYTFFDALEQVPLGFATCDVFPANNRQVILQVRGIAGTNKRCRLRIYGLYAAV